MRNRYVRNFSQHQESRLDNYVNHQLRKKPSNLDELEKIWAINETNPNTTYREQRILICKEYKSSLTLRNASRSTRQLWNWYWEKLEVGDKVLCTRRTEWELPRLQYYKQTSHNPLIIHRILRRFFKGGSDSSNLHPL